MEKRLRVLVFKDGENYVAQCLEYDVAAQGRTEEETKERLKVAFKAEMTEAGKKGIQIAPAPTLFHAIHVSDDISRTEVTLAVA